MSEDKVGEKVGCWWVRGGERWVSLLEEMARDGVPLPWLKVADFSRRLQALLATRQQPKESKGEGT